MFKLKLSIVSRDKFQSWTENCVKSEKQLEWKGIGKGNKN